MIQLLVNSNTSSHCNKKNMSENTVNHCIVYFSHGNGKFGQIKKFCISLVLVHVTTLTGPTSKEAAKT